MLIPEFSFVTSSYDFVRTSWKFWHGTNLPFFTNSMLNVKWNEIILCFSYTSIPRALHTNNEEKFLYNNISSVLVLNFPRLSFFSFFFSHIIWFFSFFFTIRKLKEEKCTKSVEHTMNVFIALYNTFLSVPILNPSVEY